ncbi:alpha/beta hydrolase [Arthrobacter sp. MSA 4-2]|uniref:alpha/beta fold hydrolase n=1 Tax=Arthrobacter sp. MSA 4-2 TaxID=2794349 RepID=UPI0027DC7D12|nr:alpha/beta hydrolase [Arthrobacter sp. MSA 4-2]
MRRRGPDAGTGPAAAEPAAPAAAPRTAQVRTVPWEGRLQRYWDFAPLGHAGRPAARQDAAAPVMFLVHGFRGDHHGLLRIVEGLPGYRVIVPDLPGFGASEALAGRHDVTAYARFVRHSLEVLGLGPSTVLLGHSFGSVIAARFAADNPGRTAALILVNPICEPALEGSSRLASRAAELYYAAGARLPERTGMALLTNPLIVRVMSIFMAKTRDRALRAYIHDQHARYFSAFAERRVVLEAFRASIGATVRDSATDLTGPVLLIAAELDDLGSLEGQRRLAAMIPGARLEVLAGTGHLVHYEKPLEAAALITAFLKEGRQ